jgi:hypothetical protein
MLKIFILFAVLLVACEARYSANCTVVSIPDVLTIPYPRSPTRYGFAPIAVANGSFVVTLFENQHRVDWNYGQLQTAELFRYSLTLNETYPCYVNKKLTDAVLDNSSGRLMVSMLLLSLILIFFS